MRTVGLILGFSYVVNQLAVSFTDGSQAGDGAITGWSWDFGDDSTSMEQNPVHVYQNTGIYSVSFTVTDENGLSSDPYTEDVQAGGLSIGPFSFYPNPSSGVFLGQVTLDGVPATEDDVIAAFDSEGNCAGAGIFTVYEGDAYIYNFSIYGDDLTTDDYDEGMDMGEDFTLKLWVSSSELTINYSDSFSGWSNQNGAPMPGYDDPYVVYNFSTSDLQPPVADFSGDPRSGDAPLTVQFMDESIAGSGVITAWTWNFMVDAGFGGSQSQNPSFEYLNPGVYTVSLTVTDEANSLESSITQENYILVGTAGENDAPLATDINVSVMEDETIEMQYALNSFDADGDELTFSASGAEHGSLPEGGMVYAPHADYYGFDSFTYTATDPSGLSDTATVFVIIIPVDNDPPVAVIDVEGDPEGDGFVETTEDVTLSGWGSYDVDECPGAPGNTEGCTSFQGSFEWSTVNAPEDFNLQIPEPGYASFDAPEVEADQNFVFSLRVTDGQFWSDLAIVTVTVQNNNAPVLDSIGIQYMTQDSLLSEINLSATDEEDDPLTFNATSSDPDNVTIVGVVSSSDTTAVLTLSYADGWTGFAYVTASVCDGYHCDSETFSVWVSPSLGVDDIVVLPEVFALRQNYPNPFNPVTTIAYDIPEIANVRIDMYNILGQKVRTLVNGTHQPGVYHVRWNGTNDFGNPLSSGMYFYRISSEQFISVKKLVLMK